MRLQRLPMLRTVNIRALKDRLSAYLKDVQRGDVVLVSDRGRVVAEIRPPLVNAHAIESTEGKLQRLAEAGVLRLGLPNEPQAYRRTGLRLSAEVVEAALRWTRAEG